MTKTIASCGIFFLLLSGLNSFGSSGVTPTSCVPKTLTHCCGFGITNVTFNTINQNSNDGVDGYMDSSSVQTTVLEGQTYTISIKTNASSTQNYAVWIDFNNNGILNDVNERVLTISSQLNASGSILIPVGAALNTPLRMRVSADYDFSAAPLPCSDLDFGQAEDYGIVITSNPNPPVSLFTSDPRTTCDRTVCFTDKSLNIPTGWLWDFGDGNTSFQQNPCHTYAADGTYTIKLTTTNANGSDIDSLTNYINVNTAGQVNAASCNPATFSYCCDYGIYEVIFNTINKTSGSGEEGYQDFSCSNATTITEGMTYLLSIQTSPNNAQDTRAWIDYNNDGVFNNSNELVLDAPNIYNPSESIIIPGGAVLNTPLRMRVSSDVVGASQSACDDNDFGQTEDYGLIILENTSPPVTKFSATPTYSCNDSIYFKDLSTNAPTSWEWDFGDGTTSNSQNPVHLYSKSGIYTIKLTTTNAHGQNSITVQNYILINCNETNMPSLGIARSADCLGTLYDDGGPSANYSNRSDGIFTIEPTNASAITLDFISFNFVGGITGDALYIYDGPSVSSPLIRTLSGNTLPGTINSSGSSITIRQITNSFQNDPGFKLNWWCNSTVDIDENKIASNNFIVYPNPTKGVINVKQQSEAQLIIKEINLLNTVGEVIMKNIKLKNQGQIDISHLPKGLYFLTFLNNEGLYTKKINLQ